MTYILLTQAFRKLGYEIDSETKNLIINGDRTHLAIVLRRLLALYESSTLEDSLDAQDFKKASVKQETMRESLTLSRSEEPA